MGLTPIADHYLSGSLLDSLLNIVVEYRDRIYPNVVLPGVTSREGKKKEESPPLSKKSATRSKP